jgi:hypothetical protein
MAPTTLTPQTKAIPPDLAAVLGGAAIHPALLRGPARPVTPTVATLTSAALALAEYVAERLAAQEAAGIGRGWRQEGAGELISGALDHGEFGHQGFVHTVGSGGVLHLELSARLRAVSLARGVLTQRCTSRPRLRPGVVRLLPPGYAATLADLDGDGALAIEVVF